MFAFLRRIFFKGETSLTLTDRLFGPGAFSVEVAGVSRDTHNLDLFWEATSNRWQHQKLPDGDSWNQTTDARLVSRPDDLNAIDVEIAGKKIGSLSRTESIRIRQRLKQLGYDRIDATCKARVSGRPKWWEVKLDITENLIDQVESDQQASS